MDTSITKQERAAIYELGNALCAPPKIIPPYIKENLNDYANRRARLALDTFENCLKVHLHAIQEEQKGMSDPYSPGYLLKSGRISMILDLLEEMIITKRGF